MLMSPKPTGSFRNRVLSTIPVLALLVGLTACGPKPTDPSPTPPPAGGPTETQASPDLASASPDVTQASPTEAPASPDLAQASPGPAQSPAASPQSPAPGDASPGTQGSPSAPPEAAVQMDPKVLERWKDVDEKSVLAQATKAMQERSKQGVALFRQGDKDHKVQFGAMEVLGVEPDSSQRLGVKVQFDGKEVPGQIVATKDGEKLSFDAVAVDFPDGRITFHWNEGNSAWIAVENPKP